MQSKKVAVDRADLAQRAHRHFAHGGADFARCLIERVAPELGCERMRTFGPVAVEAAGMTLAA